MSKAHKSGMYQNPKQQNETTETKQEQQAKPPKRPKRNYRDDRNETTVMTKTKHYNDRDEWRMKYRGKSRFHFTYSPASKGFKY